MGLSMLTLLEIFTNPDDLAVAIGQGQRDGKFAFMVCRGPGHNYKPLLTTNGIFESRQEAVRSLWVLLLFVIDKGKEMLEDPNDPVSRIINPDNRPVSEMKVLTRQAVDALIATLADADEAETF